MEIVKSLVAFLSISLFGAPKPFSNSKEQEQERPMYGNKREKSRKNRTQ